MLGGADTAPLCADVFRRENRATVNANLHQHRPSPPCASECTGAAPH